MSVDLEDVIADAVNDASVDVTPETVEDTPVEASPVEAPETPVEAPPEEVPAEPVSAEVPSPAAKAAVDTEGVDKKIGIPSHTNGRENRIPYSRVKKIVENAEKPLQAKVSEYETKLKEYEPKIKGYEELATKVANFEHVMINDQPKFLQYLSSLPQYQQFFKAVQDLQVQAQTQAQAQPQTVDNDPMPQPGADGSYDMEGLKTLLDWQKRQAKAEFTKEVDQQYGPIRKQYEAQQRLNEAIPKVEAQIRQARSWDKFTENEAEITTWLQRNPTGSLEQAYVAVVVPKLRQEIQSVQSQAQVNMTEARKKILAEIQSAPTSTSAPARSVKPSTSAPAGKRTLEDVIAQQIREAGLSESR